MRQGLELIIITEEAYTDGANKVVSPFVPGLSNYSPTLDKLYVLERFIFKVFRTY